MFRITENRHWYLAGSGVAIILSVAALVISFSQSSPLSNIDGDVARGLGLATLAALLLTAALTWWVFRELHRSFRYGLCALAGVLHDVVITCGFFALMTILAGWTVDALFFVAILGTIALSGQGLIATFHHARENESGARIVAPVEIVSRSIVESIQHAVPARMGALLVLVAVLLLGGASFRPLTATLLVGLASATYSTPFFAAPLLVSGNRARKQA
jgi:preprotein translocase subunit SecF